MAGAMQIKAAVESCAEVAQNIFVLKFVSKEIARSALPGNFVNILVSEYGAGPLLRRPFSISQVEGDMVSLIFQKAGIGTLLLSEKKRGQMLDTLGPLGNSFRLDGDYKTALLVGGGVGMAPLPILSGFLRKKGKELKTYIGYRTSSQVYTSDLKDVHISTDDGSRGFTGNVISMLEASESGIGNGGVKIYGCGPTPMLKALAGFAKSRNIDCEVSLEGKMACGIGICQGCPVELAGDERKYALVCKDGPTFMISEIKI
jgi:dihydroorotate dehydrogenase electron transfer subunit